MVEEDFLLHIVHGYLFVLRDQEVLGLIKTTEGTNKQLGPAFR